MVLRAEIPQCSCRAVRLEDHVTHGVFEDTTVAVAILDLLHHPHRVGILVIATGEFS